MTTVAEAYAQLVEVTAAVQRLADEHPDWTVVTNHLRNWMIMDATGSYRGYIDVVGGVVDRG